MKILILSDIHANFPALKAIAEKFNPDDFEVIINCGDCLV
jgi:predicted phosphodiesterase